MSMDDRKLVLVGKTSLIGRTFSLGDSNGVVTKASFGLPDNWYGGMVKEFRKVKDSGILMCLDKRDNVINLAYVESDLTNQDRMWLALAEVVEPEIDSEIDPSLEPKVVGDEIADDTEAIQRFIEKGGKKK